jgi:hypothetical protein
MGKRFSREREKRRFVELIEDQMSEVGGQMTEVGDQRTDVR